MTVRRKYSLGGFSTLDRPNSLQTLQKLISIVVNMKLENQLLNHWRNVLEKIICRSILIKPIFDVFCNYYFFFGKLSPPPFSFIIVLLNSGHVLYSLINKNRCMKINMVQLFQNFAHLLIKHL